MTFASYQKQNKCIDVLYVKKIKFQFNQMIHTYFIIPSKSLLPSPLKPQDFTSSNEPLNVCVYCGSLDLTSLGHIWYKT